MFFEQIGEAIIRFGEENFTDIVGILILYFFGRTLLRTLVKQFQRVVDDGDDDNVSRKEQRANTLGNIILTTGNIVITTIILLMALSLVGMDIRPILAGAGVVGLAVGFGAQSLVKDFVGGLFILIENQYGIGDEVKIGAAEGEVHKLSIRSTVLKDSEGKMHYISNGSINNVINISQSSHD